MYSNELDPSRRAVKVYIRHAKSVANEQAENETATRKRVGGYQPDIPLASIGFTQARELGRILRPQLEEMIGSFTVVRFAVAPARRTRDTGSEVYGTMGNIGVPITVRSSAHELRKGNRFLGGDEKRLRFKVETPEYKDALKNDWDFRAGRPWANRMGLHVLHRAEKLRHAGARIKQWYEEEPDMTDTELPEGHRAVDILVAHGIAGYLGLGKLRHQDPANPGTPTITPHESYEQYEMKNASATVVDPQSEGQWPILGIIVPNLSQDSERVDLN